jgi:2-polyprenyl-3-methyl-5-hydroxy-6-metoxy-1,4-benzoquinol methylase
MASAHQTLDEGMEGAEIRSEPCPNCYVCGSAGEMLHEHLCDRLFGAPGSWSIRRCPNPRCGLAWLDPMPLEEDITKAYRSYYTHGKDSTAPDNVARRIYRAVSKRYLASRYGYERARNSRWGRFLGYLIYLNPIRRANIDGSVFFLDFKQNALLLDVGCGSGATLEMLDKLGWRVEGVDFDPRAVERARKRGLRVHLGELQDQGLSSDSFDVIVSAHVVEHVPDPMDLLRECHRLLKPKGHLVVITPNLGGWGHRIYGADWRGLEPPRHLHLFTVDSLAGMSAKAGFTACSCQSMVRANGVLLASRMLRRTGKADLRGVSFVQRLWAEATGLMQWAGLLVDPEAGEEIVLTCIKEEKGRG